MSTSGMDADVVVVGAGPAGLVAALTLGAHGVRPVVLERREPEEPVPGSRALFVHRDTMATIEAVSPRTGQRISDAGILWDGRSTWYAGREIFRRDDVGVHPRRPGIAPYASLPQWRTVAILREACHEAGIPLQMSTTVEAVRTRNGAVTLQTDRGSFSSAYVIAADGARSAVRTGVGLRLTGPRLEGHHVVVDLTFREDARPTAIRSLHYREPALDGRNVLTIPFAGGQQYDVQARSKADAEALLDLDSWLPRVADRLPPAHVSWVSTYRFASATADSMVGADGRVLLVGESAHLFPPFGARGMNSAVTDAYAAAEAIVLDLRSGQAGGVRRFAAARLSAARMNAHAATAGFHVLHPNTHMRARQRAAAEASRISARAGRWLEDAPYGAAIRAGGHY